MAIAAGMAVRRVGYSWVKTLWAGVIVWGLCMLVMMFALRGMNMLGLGDSAGLIGFIGFAVVGGWITWRISRPD